MAMWARSEGCVFFATSDPRGGVRCRCCMNFHDANWQHCQVHLIRNVLDSCGSKVRVEVAKAAKLISSQPTCQTHDGA